MMQKKIKKLNVIYIYYKNQIKNFLNSIKDFSKILEYHRDWKRFSKMKTSESFKNIFPMPLLHDRTQFTKFDRHYFYQDIWAYKKIFESKNTSHVDVGSRGDFVGLLTAITEVTLIDIRPLRAQLDNLINKKGNILSMPFENDSITSLSCLHVAEHIGLGRYGDRIDPMGTKKAIKELSRVLALGGNLYFSLPIGEPKIFFNAHRIHSTAQILDYFSDLELVELSGVDDKGQFIIDVDRKVLDSCRYGSGLFWFTKKKI